MDKCYKPYDQNVCKMHSMWFFSSSRITHLTEVTLFCCFFPVICSSGHLWAVSGRTGPDWGLEAGQEGTLCFSHHFIQHENLMCIMTPGNSAVTKSESYCTFNFISKADLLYLFLYFIFLYLDNCQLFINSQSPCRSLTNPCLENSSPAYDFMCCLFSNF